MAKFVFTDGFLSLNAVDLSDHVESITLTHGADTPESTAMSDLSHRRLPGLLDWSVEVSFRQDFAAANVDATLFPLVGAAAFAMEIRPDSAVVSATNPKFTGNVLIQSYGVLTGTVADTANSPVTLIGDGTLTRAET